MNENQPTPVPDALQLRSTNDCPATCGTCATDEHPDVMSLSEVEANLGFFSEHFQIREFVLSGSLTIARQDFGELMALVRNQGFERVTLIGDGLHWTESAVEECRGCVDRVVVALSPSTAADWHSDAGESESIRRAVLMLRDSDIAVQSSTQLRSAPLQVLESITDFISAQKLEAPTFIYPFATSGADALRDVPPWATMRGAVEETFARLEAQSPRLKNLPPCIAGSLQRFTFASKARLYVKHDRQLDKHARIPPFVGMTHDEPCADCAHRPQCDGYWPAHVQTGRIDPPAPALA